VFLYNGIGLRIVVEFKHVYAVAVSSTMILVVACLICSTECFNNKLSLCAVSALLRFASKGDERPWLTIYA
jgi:hypothetical protein